MAAQNEPIKLPSPGEAIDRHPITVCPEIPLSKAIALMSQRGLGIEPELTSRNHSYLIVLEGERMAGIFTRRDAVRITAEGANLQGVTVSEVMTTKVITLAESEFKDIFAALSLFRQHRIRHLPIVDEVGQLVGVVTHDRICQMLDPSSWLKWRRVAEVMETEVVIAPLTASALEVVQLMAAHRVSSVVICDTAHTGGRLPIGTITEADILQVPVMAKDLAKIQAQTIVRELPFCLQPTDSLWTAQTQMQKYHVGRLVVCDAQGELVGIVSHTSLLLSLESVEEIYRVVGSLQTQLAVLEREKTELIQRQNTGLTQLVEERTAMLQEQARYDRLLAEMLGRIRQSLHLEEILQTAVTEVRQLLDADRVIIYRFQPDWNGIVAVESVVIPQLSIFGRFIEEPCMPKMIERYQQGHWSEIEDIYTANLSPCYLEMLAGLQVRANLVVPILVGEQLWGLLIAHQCSGVRHWQQLEKNLLQQLATQIGIAIFQSELYRRAQTEIEERKQVEMALAGAKQELETRVEDRTAELRATVKQLEWEITERKQAEQALWESQSCMKLINNIGLSLTPSMSESDAIATTIELIGKQFPDLRVAYTKVDHRGKLEVVEAVVPRWLPVQPENGQQTQTMIPGTGYQLDLQDYPSYLAQLRSHKSIIIDKLTEVADIPPLKDFLASLGVEAYLQVPLPLPECCVLSFGANSPWRWSHYEMTTIVEVADYLAVRLKEIRAQQRRATAEAALKRQNLKSRLFTDITLKIRQSLRLEEILQTTVMEVQHILQADRVLVYQVFADGSGKAITEAVIPGLPAIMGMSFPEEVFPIEYQNLYAAGRVCALADVHTEDAQISGCLAKFVATFGVRAKLVVPILQGDRLWGLLIAHQCSGPREWSDFEVDLLQQLANQVGIALAQAQLVDAIQESERKFRAIFNQTFELVVLVRPDGRVLEANQTALDFGNINCDDVVGLPFWETHWWQISPETQSQLHDAVVRAAAGDFVRYEVEVFGVNTQVLTIDFSIKPVKNATGQVVFLIAEGRDISDVFAALRERERAEGLLKASLAEKEVLLKEIHHRVKNNLHVISSLLDLQSRTMDNEKDRQLFADSQTRIQAMALIHEQLYSSSDLGRINFGDYIKRMALQLLASYNVGSKAIEYDLNLQPLFLNLETAIPCSLILNELISNALKHAFKERQKGKIFIELQKPDMYHLTVSDNGGGLPTNMDWQKANSFGWRLMRILTKQIKGELYVKNDSGARFEIVFRELNYKQRF
ncbi:MAG TPA: GAF domain-containing protein [Oscillatoriaceae cyanobacterium M33_DOE_052]|uniref:GAF domain-containing protein n=1 Tax=Planktothricoides sp. SpSt-374 TaxID=2282167 RepID=A0A7C3ZRT9_9CYAN|nr:GAF domain-containing protein [Oscillatoriaceae cyanobacterium M33_DOE_052]